MAINTRVNEPLLAECEHSSANCIRHDMMAMYNLSDLISCYIRTE